MGDDVDAAPRVERAKLDPARRAASLKKRIANRDRGVVFVRGRVRSTRGGRAGRREVEMAVAEFRACVIISSDKKTPNLRTSPRSLRFLPREHHVHGVCFPWFRRDIRRR